MSEDQDTFADNNVDLLVRRFRVQASEGVGRRSTRVDLFAEKVRAPEKLHVDLEMRRSSILKGASLHEKL